MPLAWIHNLPREEAEKMAVELGVSIQGTLDELRKRLKEKWRAVEHFLPPQSTDVSEASMDAAGCSGVQSSDVHAHVTSSQIKLGR
jgi:hypothetical protein